MSLPSPVTGLHHVTSITGAAQDTLDWYGTRLGLRLVKQTVNFDDPSSYHLYFADGQTRPGSFLTFFPVAGARQGQVGAGQTTATAYAVPEGALADWADALTEADEPFREGERFGEKTLTLRDPWGLVYDLIETPEADGAWDGSPVPTDRGLGAFHSVTLCSHRPEATALVLTSAYGYEEHGQEGDRLRLVNKAADRARYIDLFCDGADPGRGGAGTVHHIAFRVPSDEAELEVRERLIGIGLQPTEVRDRQYFRSVYAREPGGVLFEVATDPPGFALDEPEDRLGEALKLPPQYEAQRDRIEAALPALQRPY
ncbi:MAG: ring-cleaving dioxygenase [Bacteroidota bacterium]